jgi:hypothetical protein
VSISYLLILILILTLMLILKCFNITIGEYILRVERPGSDGVKEAPRLMPSGGEKNAGDVIVINGGGPGDGTREHHVSGPLTLQWSPSQVRYSTKYIKSAQNSNFQYQNQFWSLLFLFFF